MKKPISRILISRTLERAKALRARINSTEAFQVLEFSALLKSSICRATHSTAAVN